VEYTTQIAAGHDSWNANCNAADVAHKAALAAAHATAADAPTYWMIENRAKTAAHELARDAREAAESEARRPAYEAMMKEIEEEKAAEATLPTKADLTGYEVRNDDADWSLVPTPLPPPEYSAEGQEQLKQMAERNSARAAEPTEDSEATHWSLKLTTDNRWRNLHSYVSRLYGSLPCEQRQLEEYEHLHRLLSSIGSTETEKLQTILDSGVSTLSNEAVYRDEPWKPPTYSAPVLKEGTEVTIEDKVYVLADDVYLDDLQNVKTTAKDGKRRLSVMVKPKS
jgi:hypothetical protein